MESLNGGVKRSSTVKILQSAKIFSTQVLDFAILITSPPGFVKIVLTFYTDLVAKRDSIASVV